MGLTVHYHLSAPAETDATGIHTLVHQLRQSALGFKRRGRLVTVGPLEQDAAGLRSARTWPRIRSRYRPDCHLDIEVSPLEGCVFWVDPGDNCESMLLGLCRYPPTVRAEESLRRTNLRGWRLHSFCKTQYASLHGWGHFRRCHTAVIDLLLAAQRVGFTVEISDEGDYWPGRNLRALRESIGMADAASAGAEALPAPA